MLLAGSCAGAVVAMLVVAAAIRPSEPAAAAGRPHARADGDDERGDDGDFGAAGEVRGEDRFACPQRVARGARAREAERARPRPQDEAGTSSPTARARPTRPRRWSSC